MQNTEISKILIVDDNSFYLSVLKTILKDVEATVYLASSGKEALSLLDENSFALSVLDIQMPEMDGFELAGHIRNQQDRDILPIIFLTAYSSDEIQMFKGYDNGAIDYLTKPVNKTVFISKVKIFLELDRQKRNLIKSKESLQESKIELEKKQIEMKLQNEALQHAQTETEESRKKYFKLYDFAPIGYCTINIKGNILEINLKGAKLLGYEYNKLIDLNLKEFVTIDSHSILNKFLSNIFENKEHTGCEVKFKQTSGKSVFVYLKGAMIDEDQKCLLSMTDITELKEAQMALIESEELYHSLLKTSPDGIIITDLEGRITEASDVAMELAGNMNNIEGKHFMDFIPDKSQGDLTKICKTTLKLGMIQNFEIMLKRIDQTELFGEISTTQIKGNDGEIKAFMSVIRDITERKTIEKQLRHSERMTGIGELATGMAHEINQPLNTISLIIDNIIYSIDAKTITEDYLKSKINKVFDNITRIRKIIDHVRTFSRDQDDFVLTDFEINTSIQNCISMISEQFSHKEIELSFQAAKNIPTLSGNAYRFEQVILNMLINAKDAIEEKKKRNNIKFKKKIEVSTTLQNKFIIVEIKDNGIGISPENIDKVLLPFFTTKEPGKGTGLGLSISYGIIKELGGEIEIQSNPISGTTISMKIPIQVSVNKKYTFSYVQ